jgi:hypothetical protein
VNKNTIAHAVLTFAVLVLPFNALAQSSTCLNREEADGLVTFALPTLIRGVAQQCITSLPATAPLVQAGSITAARYQVDADRAWPIARVAFDKVAGLPLAGLAGEAGVKMLVQQGFARAISQEMNADDCATADALINILQPLPARNMAMLITTLMGAGSKTLSARLPVKICRTTAIAALPVPDEPK